jgi:hypothetical protein
MNSIPASQLVNVIPGVLGAGGSPLSLNSVFITENSAIPIDADVGYSVMSFPTLEAVQDFFGPSSDEATVAATYFAGFTNATTLPGLLYFTRYNPTAAGAYLRGGALALTLTQLQALSGTIIVSIDGRVTTSANVDLSSATSFTNAAVLLTTGLQTTGGIFTGQATQAGNTLTVTSVGSGALHIGDTVTGASIGPATVTAFLTGTGGTGTYTVSTTETVAVAETVTVSSTATVTWDAQRDAFVVNSATTGATSTLDGFATGTLAASLNLQAAQGAVLSQGAAAATPAAVLGDVINQTQNWALFMTLVEYATDVKVAFADWANTSNQRYAYVGWDTDILPTQGAAPTAFAPLTATYNGRIAHWGLAGATGARAKGAFWCGMVAAINFAETNGRITAAYKSQAGLVPDVTDATIANNLLLNGYNFYGSYATANDQFQFLQNGSISGNWKWADAYINQIKLNSDLQLALVTLMSQSKSIPYVTRGYDLLRAACLGPINAAVNFGSIVAGVNLSPSQRQQVNTAAGNPNVASVLQSRGWYLQILDADAVTRGERGSPPMTLWYTDGGSIQKINLASIDVQ